MIIKGNIVNASFDDHNDDHDDAVNQLDHALTMLPRDKTKTFHQNEKDVCSNIRPYMDILKYQIIYSTLQLKWPKQCIETIDGMNEIYISAIGAGGSDRVFETEHVDGPFFLLPYCHVYRCIVGITPNRTVLTYFPIQNESICIDHHEFVAFDYNRDIHVITTLPKQASDTPRITIKFHYISYPKFLPTCIVNFYKWMHTRYNQYMRFLFLQAQESRLETQRQFTMVNTVRKGLSLVINSGTVGYCSMIRWYYQGLDAMKR